MFGRSFVGNITNTLNHHERGNVHVCADVSMLDEIPDRDGQGQHTETGCAAHHLLDT